MLNFILLYFHITLMIFLMITVQDWALFRLQLNQYNHPGLSDHNHGSHTSIFPHLHWRHSSRCWCIVSGWYFARWGVSLYCQGTKSYGFICFGKSWWGRGRFYQSSLLLLQFRLKLTQLQGDRLTLESLCLKNGGNPDLFHLTWRLVPPIQGYFHLWRWSQSRWCLCWKWHVKWSNSWEQIKTYPWARSQKCSLPSKKADFLWPS